MRTGSVSSFTLPKINLDEHLEDPSVLAAMRAVLKEPHLVNPDHEAGRLMLPINFRAGMVATANADLSLDRWTTLLRKLDDGRTALIASLPQDVTHVEIVVHNKSGSKRTVVVPKDADITTLGRLAPDTRVTITPLKDKERGVPLDLVWTPKAPMPPIVASVVEGYEKLAAGGGSEAELIAGFENLIIKQNTWSKDQWLLYWGDAGTSSRARLLDALVRLDAQHPDLTIPGTPPRKLSAIINQLREAEQLWRDQIKTVNRGT